MRDKYRCVDCGVETTPDTGHRGGQARILHGSRPRLVCAGMPERPTNYHATFCASDV
jgi:hypothetical protein